VATIETKPQLVKQTVERHSQLPRSDGFNRKGLVKAIRRRVARSENRTHLRRAGTVRRREASLASSGERGWRTAPASGEIDRGA
jgi:hypothetical protein